MSLIPSFFGFPFSSNAGDTTATALANARIDWKETQESHVFKVDVPGLKKEEVKVEVEDGSILLISGERSKEQEEKNDRWHRVERSSGKFLRRFRLPENAKLDAVKAAMENGVLTVMVPKEEVKKPEAKEASRFRSPEAIDSSESSCDDTSGAISGETASSSLHYATSLSNLIPRVFSAVTFGVGLGFKDGAWKASEFFAEYGH
ncbi:hypothetical protein OROMI_033827 [Orobanche minor]